jgi:hypothetical protein
MESGGMNLEKENTGAREQGKEEKKTLKFLVHGTS